MLCKIGQIPKMDLPLLPKVAKHAVLCNIGPVG